MHFIKREGIPNIIDDRCSGEFTIRCDYVASELYKLASVF